MEQPSTRMPLYTASECALSVDMHVTMRVDAAVDLIQHLRDASFAVLKKLIVGYKIPLDHIASAITETSYYPLQELFCRLVELVYHRLHHDELARRSIKWYLPAFMYEHFSQNSAAAKKICHRQFINKLNQKTSVLSSFRILPYAIYSGPDLIGNDQVKIAPWFDWGRSIVTFYPESDSNGSEIQSIPVSCFMDIRILQRKHAVELFLKSDTVLTDFSSVQLFMANDEEVAILCQYLERHSFQVELIDDTTSPRPFKRQKRSGSPETPFKCSVEEDIGSDFDAPIPDTQSDSVHSLSTSTTPLDVVKTWIDECSQVMHTFEKTCGAAKNQVFDVAEDLRECMSGLYGVQLDRQRSMDQLQYDMKLATTSLQETRTNEVPQVGRKLGDVVIRYRDRMDQYHEGAVALVCRDMGILQNECKIGTTLTAVVVCGVIAALCGCLWFGVSIDVIWIGQTLHKLMGQVTSGAPEVRDFFEMTALNASSISPHTFRQRLLHIFEHQVMGYRISE